MTPPRGRTELLWTQLLGSWLAAGAWWLFSESVVHEAVSLP